MRLLLINKIAGLIHYKFHGLGRKEGDIFPILQIDRLGGTLLLFYTFYVMYRP